MIRGGRWPRREKRFKETGFPDMIMMTASWGLGESDVAGIEALSTNREERSKMALSDGEILKLGRWSDGHQYRRGG